MLVLPAADNPVIQKTRPGVAVELTFLDMSSQRLSVGSMDGTNEMTVSFHLFYNEAPS
jgi:hypothetical protein